MKHRMLLVSLAVIVIGSLVAASCAAPAPSPAPSPAPAPEKVFEWRLQSPFPETDSDFIINAKGVARLIEEGSGGRVQVETFPMGVLCEPDSIVDAVAQGAIEAGHLIGGMAADRVPSALADEMPFGTRDRDDAFVLLNLWGVGDIMKEEYATHNIHLLAKTHCGQLVFESTFPVNTVADFKGKKIWGHPNCPWLADFGASPVEVPGFDMYMAMKLGTIDGMPWTIAELEAVNLKEVVKYVMFPPLMVPGTQTLVNMDAWNALGPDLQRQIEDHIYAHTYNLSIEYDAATDVAQAAAEAYGVQFTTLPEAEVAKLRAASRSFWAEVAGMSPYAGRMIDMYKAFMKEKGIPW